MSGFAETLSRRLDEIRSRGLWRELRTVDSAQGAWVQIGGRTYLNFSSNDYLGLAGHDAVKRAAAEAAQHSGAGSGASRLICGSLGPHHRLELELARFKGVPAAVVFGSGYAAALGTIPALVGTGDVVILDKLSHACLVDGARLSGARLRVFDHNDLQDLERILRWARESPSRSTSEGNEPAVLIVTESVFSMDGDQAPLEALVALKDRFGAWLMVDEAHATGMYGAQRRGLVEATGLGDQVEVQMGTLGKALGAAGGYIAGSQALRELLINRARSFIFSTAPPPAQTAAAGAALQVVRSPEGEGLVTRLWDRVGELRQGLRELGWLPQPVTHPQPADRQPTTVRSPILPLKVGAEASAMAMAEALRREGLFVPAIRYPTVARGAARLRVTVSATHSREDIQRLLTALGTFKAPSHNHAGET